MTIALKSDSLDITAYLLCFDNAALGLGFLLSYNKLLQWKLLAAEEKFLLKSLVTLTSCTYPLFFHYGCLLFIQTCEYEEEL